MPSVIDTRRDQAFPTFGADDVARLRRFGTARTYGPGEALMRTGTVSPGMFVILSGQVDATRRDPRGVAR
jgi:thioredoxin reductase (NADPH)